MDDIEVARCSAWESYIPVLDDLRRIAQHGPNLVDEFDERLIKSLCSCAVGEILVRFGDLERN